MQRSTQKTIKAGIRLDTKGSILSYEMHDKHRNTEFYNNHIQQAKRKEASRKTKFASLSTLGTVYQRYGSHKEKFVGH